MGGTVDSPTPIVPISSDSTSVISSSFPKYFESAIAATQPAVPPPAMTTFLTAPSPLELGPLEWDAVSALFIATPFEGAHDNGDSPLLLEKGGGAQSSAPLLFGLG